MPADRATSEAVTPGSKDATTRRSFSSRDQRRRLSTDVITSTRGIVIGLLLGLSLGLPTFALRPQGGRHRRDTLDCAGGRLRRMAARLPYAGSGPANHCRASTLIPHSTVCQRLPETAAWSRSSPQ